MFVCDACVKRYGFVRMARPRKITCAICGTYATGRYIPEEAVPLRERLETANKVQQLINDLYVLADEKPKADAFLDEVYKVMCAHLRPRILRPPVENVDYDVEP
jgi:hypothetical protein